MSPAAESNIKRHGDCNHGDGHGKPCWTPVLASQVRFARNSVHANRMANRTVVILSLLHGSELSDERSSCEISFDRWGRRQFCGGAGHSESGCGGAADTGGAGIEPALSA